MTAPFRPSGDREALAGEVQDGLTADADGLRKALTKALHETETSGGWWGHPECEEFARIVAPTVERILADRLAAREQQVRAQTLREAANNLPAMTERPLRVGTALWPSSDRDAYSLAIEEAQAALLARAEGEAGEGERDA